MKHKFFTPLFILMLLKSTISFCQDPVSCEPSFVASDWTCVGPLEEVNNNNIGRIVAVWVSPFNPDYILVGTRSTGIWRSTNDGETWTNLTSYQLPACGIKDIAVYNNATETTTDDIIYATTQFYGNDINVYGVGLIYSVDNGVTWVQDYSMDTDYDLAAQPFVRTGGYVGSNNLYFPPGESYFLLTNGSNIFKKEIFTHDWELFNAFTSFSISELDIKPDNNEFVIGSPNFGDLSSFVYTYDNGANWNTIICPTPADLPLSGIYNIQVLASTSIPENNHFYTLFKYLITGDNDDDPDTDDNTIIEYWFCQYEIEINTVILDWTKTITGLGNNPYEALILNVYPDYPNYAFVGRGQYTLFKADITAPVNVAFFEASQYDGTNTHTDIRDMAYYYNTTSGENYMYIAQDGGLSKTSEKELLVSGGDNDAKWNSLNGYGLTITEFNAIGGTEKEGGKLFISAPDGNSYIFTKNLKKNYPNSSDKARSEISIDNPNLGVMNSNGGFFDPETTTDIFEIDDTPSGAGNITFPSSSGITDEEIESEGLNWGYRPFKFDAENRFWMGTMDMFYYSDVEGDPATYFPASEVSAFMSPEPPPINRMRNPINSFDVRKDESSGLSYVYFSTIEPTSVEDPNKLTLSILDNTVNPYDIEESRNITPNTVLADYPSRINHSYITDIEIGRGPNEVWVAFGGSKTTYNNNWLAANDPAKKGEVYFSADYGDTWIATGLAGLPNYPVHCLEYIKGTNNVILAGTDVGVYIYHDIPGGAYWECFNTNMPYCSVSDIYISYCTNTIFISTFGYGVWECPLPDFETESPYHYKPIIFDEDYLWSSTKDAYTDIIIKPGATLTVQNCEIRMPKDGKIIVENGGKLVLDGATITNYCDFWKGIEVWGKGNSVPHPALEDVFTGEYPINDSDHGVVFLTNNAKIESAEVAITTYNSAYPTTSTFYGGIIVARYSEFHNNITSIDIRPFDVSPSNTDDDNINEFYMCKFSKDEQMPCDIYASSDVFLDDVDGVLFHACKFENTFSSCTDFNFPIGINSTNATYTVESDCNFAGDEGCEVNETYFSGYYRGVYASNSAARPRTIIIDDVHFINNERSILLSAVTQSEIFRNYFEIPDFSSKTGYGLYLEGCLNYHVEGNYFTSLGTLTSNSHFCSGILVENNHNIATQIYRNTFENIEIGIRSQGNNSKLQLRCNDFISPIHDYNIIVTSGTLGNQGICNATITQPAGNIFSFNGETESDFRIVPSGVTLNYRHHTESDYIPIDYTTTNINLHNCGVSGGDDCVSTLPGGIGGEGRMSTIEATGYQEAIDLELSKIDGGNTEGFIADIQGGVSPTEVKYLLDEASPYISNEVLVTMLAAEPLGTSEILDVMNNNYPISDTVATTLEVSNYNVPSPVIEALNEDIINNHLNVSAMTDLLATVSILETKREYAIMQSFNDLIKESKIDSALSIIDEEAGDWAQQLEIQFLSAASNYIDAEAALSNYTIFDETGENFISLYSVLIGLDSSGRTVSEITEVEESTLRSIANKETPSGIAAQNILDAVFQEKYPEVIDEIPELMVRLADFDINTTNQGFKIYPNPVDNILYIEITNWDEKINYWANIYDMKGIKVATYDLRKDYKLSWIETEKILTGIYLIEVYSGNQILGTQKIIFE